MITSGCWIFEFACAPLKQLGGGFLSHLYLRPEVTMSS